MSKKSSSPGGKIKILLALIAGTILLATYGQAQSSSTPQIGSPNTVTADPPVPRPNTRPCTVQLFSGFTFADFSLHPFSFTPPSDCPGPWAKVVLQGDFSVSAGRQFDRTAIMWIGGTNVYFGTTPEPSSLVSPSWHFERDLTDYSPLFTTAQTGRVDLGNVVNSTFTGILSGNADLQFYPLAKAMKAPRTADVVLPLAADATGGAVDLVTSTSTLARTFTMPANVELAFLDVIAQSQANDEFWYTCVPDDVAQELQSCGSTGFRESEVSIDGQPAGIAPVYPWIYTGGIDPFLWRPIPGVQTLNFAPYRVDLTPFAGVLSNGQPHQVSIGVFNANQHFSTTATLLLFLDHESAKVTGGVTENTLTSGPTPTVKEDLTNTNGNITGTVTVSSSRRFEVAGFVKTSHGEVRTEVVQDIHFSNQQQFDISATKFVQDISQATNISSLTTTTSRGKREAAFQEQSWPVTVDISFIVNADNSSAQTTTIHQALKSTEVTSENGIPRFFRITTNEVAPSDTLLFNSAGAFTSRQGQQSSQKFFTADSTGACFSRAIVAATGLLTEVTDGKGCDQDRDRDRDRE